MGRSKKSLLAFNAGELTPKLDGRIDTEKYAKGCRQLQNFIPFPHGGVTRRKGFEFIAAAKFDPASQSSRCSFIKFQFSRTQAFLIEVGEAYMRFYFQGNQIQLGGSPYEIVSPYTAADAANIQYVQINDVVFITHPSYPPYSLSRIADNNWTMSKISYLPPPFLDGNITTTTITPSAKTGAITLTASASTFLPSHVGGLWAVNYNRTVTQIDQTITSNTTSASSIFVDGGYTVITSGTWTADVVIQNSVDGGSTWVEVIRYKGTSNINKNANFTQTPPALIRINIENWVSQSNAANVTVEATDSLVYGIVEITGYTSATVATGTVRKTLFNTTATTYWAEAAWSPLRGYPAAICFFQSRLFYGGTIHQPDTVWGCVVDDYYNFTTGTDDSASVAFTIASEDRNQIIWMIGQDRIIAGTSGGEFAIGGSDIKQTIAPSNIFVKKQSNFGSITSRPLVIGGAVLFIRRTGLKLMEVIYDSIRQQYVSGNLAELSDHLLAGGFRSPCYQADRDSIFWGISDRGLIGMTYEKEQNVIAWHRHTTQGTFEAVETIYGTLDDEVWVSVIRTIGGVKKRFIERMTGYYNPTVDVYPETVVTVPTFSVGLTYTSDTQIKASTGFNVNFFSPDPVVSPYMTVTPTGGAAPYTYLWQRLTSSSGRVIDIERYNGTQSNAITDPIIYFADNPISPVDSIFTLRCQVTDALGNIEYSPTVNIRFTLT